MSVSRMTLTRSLGIGAIALVGTAMVFGSLVVFNRISHTPEADDLSPTVNFTVPPPPPPPPPERRDPPPRPPRQTNQPNLAPLPNLGASLSGIAISLPEFEAGGVQGVADSLLGDLDDVALTDDTVDESAAFRNRAIPEYPERARQREIEGSVLVSVLVGTDGLPKATQILQATPAGVFDQAVLAAVQASTFEPARYQGQPVEQWVNIPYPFSLN